MNNFIKTLAALTAAMALTAPANAAVHTAKRVVELHADGSRPCVIFRLEGVDQADSAVNGSHWLVLPRSHAAFTELFAILLTAKAANLPVNIHTTGTATATCDGLATVHVATFV